MSGGTELSDIAFDSICRRLGKWAGWPEQIVNRIEANPKLYILFDDEDMRVIEEKLKSDTELWDYYEQCIQYDNPRKFPRRPPRDVKDLTARQRAVAAIEAVYDIAWERSRMKKQKRAGDDGGK